MTDLNKAAAEYARPHCDGYTKQAIRTAYLEGAQHILDCPEVVGLVEALQFNKWRWEIYVKYHPEAKDIELRDETLKREKAAFEALTAFDKLRGAE